MVSPTLRRPLLPGVSLPLLLILGCLPAGSEGTRAAGQSVESSPPSVPFVENGQAQVIGALSNPSRWIRERLWVETEVDSDGDGAPDRVHVSVVRPELPGGEGVRLPVVYETSPYYAGTAQVHEILWDVRHAPGTEPPPRGPQPRVEFQPRRDRISDSHVATWVPRGFAVVHSESPGTGLSQGCPTMGGENESLAPKAVIDWLNGRARGFTAPEGGDEVRADWSNGRVAMIGTSFNGTLPLAAATTGVEGLEAIIPIAPNTSYGHYYRSHGLVRSPGGYLGEDIDSLYDFVYSGPLERRTYCNTVVREELLRQQDRVTGDWNDFWESRDYVQKAEGIRAAVLIAHAWNDWNVMPEHSVRLVERLKALGTPLQMYYHQGGHGGDPPLELTNRWITRYVLGVQNGVESDPRAWIVRENDPRLEPTPYPDYPHPDARPVALFPGEGGPRSGPLAPTPPAARGPEGLIDNVRVDGSALAQAEASPHRLLYLTDRLRAPVHISGTPEVTLRLAADRPAVNLSVWLVALPWESSRRQEANFSIITRGWADPQNHRSLTQGEPLVPGEFRTLTFSLQPTDQIIPAGKQIGWMIFSSDAEFTLWPEPGAQLSVDLGETVLHLPVLGGEGGFLQAISGP
jgi:X-Pro dipeptidyl-peptidase